MVAKSAVANKNTVPTLRRYVRVDQKSFFVVVVMACLASMSAYLFIHKHYTSSIHFGNDQLFADIVMVLMPFIGFPYLVWRYKRLIKLFDSGSMLTAKIVKIEDNLVPWYFVNYEFSYEGETYRKTQVFMYTGQAEKIAGASNIKILFDPRRNQSYAISIFD